MSLFPEDRIPPPEGSNPIQIRLNPMTLHRPRQWGGCGLALEICNQLGLDSFWGSRLADSRKGTDWLHVLKPLVTYRWLDPGSEWRLHREWFKNSAMADLPGEEDSIAAKDRLYRCLDPLCEHKSEIFSFLKKQWTTLFNASYDVLLYDLTSTYFECDVPEAKEGLRRFGYGRDKRSDCVQVVIALIVTPEGFPVAYEVLPGNTSDKTTLPEFLRKIETQYGKINRLWIMDRGIPTEDALLQMRAEGAGYWVGTPPARLSQLEDPLLEAPWKPVQEQIEVKLARDGEDLYVLTRSGGRRDKEQSMRRRRLKKLWKQSIVLTEIEQAFKAPGLTPRATLEKFNAIQMIDAPLPTTDGRNLILPRTTQPEKELQLLLQQLHLTLPE